MPNILMHRSVSPRYASTVSQALGDLTPNEQLTHENHIDRQFMAMLDSYRCSGGLARAQEVFTIFKSHHGTDAATLARWIVKRSVISFDWQSKVWIPLFQFNRIDMSLQPRIAPILSALNPVFTAWELATWFARPNQWLADSTPADMISVDMNAVLDAAYTDRFICD